MAPRYDAAVVGAGILGLAHAYHLARSGRRVIVFERQSQAQGASIRNFGMLWPIGQPAGARYQMARRSLEIWLDVLRAANLWYDPCGSLHLAYHDDEAQVLREYLDISNQEDRNNRLYTAEEVRTHFPVIRHDGLRTALWSPTEVNVDPRQVIARLPAWLIRTIDVRFEFGTTVLDYDRPLVRTTGGDFHADHLVVCTGADFRELAPDTFADCKLVKCKLQMMRSQPYGDSYRIGTMLAAGLTLRHYTSFAACPSLPALIRRFDAELPDYGRYGIHVLLSRNAVGEYVLGDSHEYGDSIEPFDKPEIDDLILAYLRTFVTPPDLRISARWHGIYVKHPTEPYIIAHPRAGMTAVTGVGGAGMTLSFGLAEQVVTSL